MSKAVKLPLLLVMAFALAACAIPRGAAIKSEVLRDQQKENPTFQVVEVTRELTPLLAKWPGSGWHGHYHWFGPDRAPDSSAIRTGDAVTVIVWDTEEDSLLTGGATRFAEIPAQPVSETGRIFLPYVGDVNVRGMTSSRLRSRLQQQYETILPSAQVQVSVTPGRNNAVDIVSGVRAPGRYPLESRDTKILSLLALAGGIDGGLRNPLVRLIRGGRTYETRAQLLLEDASRNVRVRGGDKLIIVSDDRSFNSLGATGNQQVVFFEKDEVNVLEALSTVNGLDASRANIKGVLILREYKPKDLKPGLAGPDKQQVIFSVNITSADGLFAARQFSIQPGDTLLATESVINSARTIAGLFGTFVGVGTTVNNLSN